MAYWRPREYQRNEIVTYLGVNYVSQQKLFSNNIASEIARGLWVAENDSSRLPTIESDTQVELEKKPNTEDLGSLAFVDTANLTSTTVADTSISINIDVGTDVTLLSGTDLKTVNGVSIIGSGNIAVGGAANLSKNTVADTSIDINIDTGTDIQLLSGTDFKTINGTSIIGSGNIVVGGAANLSSVTVADTSIAINIDTGTDVLLLSGTDFKTVNGTSIIGSGDISIPTAANLSKNTVADTSIDINIDTGTDIQLLSGTDIKTVNFASLIGPGNLDFYIAPDQVGFMVWAEENASINPATNSGFQFAYGNGANNDRGVKIPYAGVVTALTLQGDSNFTSADIELYVNGVGSGANITANAVDNAQVTGLSIPIAAGDNVTFRTIAGSGGTRVVVGAFIEHINSVNFTPTGPEGRTPYPIEVAYNSGLF